MVLKRARVEGRARVRAIKSVKNNWIGVMGSTREGGGGGDTRETTRGETTEGKGDRNEDIQDRRQREGRESRESRE